MGFVTVNVAGFYDFVGFGPSFFDDNGNDDEDCREYSGGDDDRGEGGHGESLLRLRAFVNEEGANVGNGRREGI